MKKLLELPKNMFLKLSRTFTIVYNSSKLLPPFYLSVSEIFVGSKKVLHAFVPVSSQVHRCKQKIFIRDGSSDRDITDRNREVSNLYVCIAKTEYFWWLNLGI